MCISYFRGTLSLVLVPLKLTLAAYASLVLGPLKVKIFEANVWFYAMKAITSIILRFGTDGVDLSAPEFKQQDVSASEKILSKSHDHYHLYLSSLLRILTKLLLDSRVDIAEKQFWNFHISEKQAKANKDARPLPAGRKRKKRQVEELEPNGCVVEQIRGRAPDDPAYTLTFFQFDAESSPLSLYCSKCVLHFL